MEESVTSQPQSAARISKIDFFIYLICSFAGLGLVFAYLRIMGMPIESQVTFMTDDGFYYLTLARNFDQLGQWTFDRGISLTSGFHPLFGYVLVLLHKIAPDPRLFVQAAMGSQLICFSLVMVLAALSSAKLKSPVLLFSFFLIVVSSTSLTGWTSMMEWPFVLLSAGLLCFSLRFSTSANFAWFVAIGVLMSISRSDTGLLPAMLCLVTLLTWKRHRNATVVKQCIAGLAGAALGVLLVLVHAQVTTGELIPGSAKMKSLWTTMYGAPDILPIGRLLISLLPGQMVNPILGIIPCIVLIGIGLACYKLIFRECKAPFVEPALWSRETTVNVALVAGSLFTIVGYLFFYMFASMGIGFWYSANFIIPLTLLWACAVQVLWTKTTRARLLLGAVCAFVIIFQVSVFCKLTYGLFTWHSTVVAASRYMAEHMAGKRIGCFNAGIPGYLAGQNAYVVNLDGLVNNDIYACAKNQTFMDYLRSRKIEYIADWPSYIPSSGRMSGGGNNFRDALEVVKAFPVTSPDETYYDYTIYKLKDSVSHQ